MKKTFLNLMLTFSSSALFAQWNTSATINTPVAVVTKSQSNIHAVTDLAGGAIIGWDDNRNSATTSSDIYAQRINNAGYAKWTTNGVAICTDAAKQSTVSVADAGNGSAIFTWEDERAGNTDIYAQKIDSSGNVLWTANGVAICTKTTNQKSPKIVGDNTGGAIIVWEDSVSFYWDIYAQRISSTGTTLWTSGGVGICTATNTQINPKVDADGLGGAIFTWQDKRNNVDYNIYAQRVNNAGAVQWTANGVIVCTASNTQSNPRIEPDGSNGALIAWVDKRNGTNYDVYAQRLNSSGAVQWTSNGVVICSAANNQSAVDIKYIGASGLMVAWKDDRTSQNSIYAQLVSLSGSPQLTSNGIKLSNAIISINPNVISDGNGGAIVAWQDSVGTEWNIKSQGLNSSGAAQWTSGGVTVCDAAGDQIAVANVTDGAGGAIYVWQDHRNTLDYDVYAHHLYSNGSTTVGISGLSKIESLQSACFPNPINSSSQIKLTNNPLNKPWQIEVFDAYGRLIEKQNINNKDVFMIDAEKYPAGIYFYFINLKDGSSFSKGSFVAVN